jgi:hypothetical protein
MIIDNFDILRSAVDPNETDAPLLVDADTVLPLAIAPERFQPVSRGKRQIFQPRGRKNEFKFVLRPHPNISRELPWKAPAKNLIRKAIFAALFHTVM